MTSIFKNKKLGFKLNLILVGTLVVAMITCGIFLSHILEKKTEVEVADQAFLMIETMNSVRSYTSNEIQPELKSRLLTESNFLPETVPAYSAREVFENLRQQPKYENFFYKEATLNPTNPRDQADKFETQLTEKFRENRSLSELTGFRVDNGQEFYYIARPLVITKESCLECHSTPDKAPANLINTYGSENGFGWQLNEIVASQMVSVPSKQIHAAARKLQLTVLAVVAFFFMVAILLTNIFLKTSIVKPIKEIASLSTTVSTGEINANSDIQFRHDSKDEIGILVKSLNRMLLSLQMAMSMIDEDDRIA